ncbi:MAG: cation transporter [Rhodospirillaceae bacterium]|nr:cation transporter [Rhodospirillaceae bacterium]
MSHHCAHNAPELGTAPPGLRHALIWVIAINATMFAVEMAAGSMAQSQALKADALDFLGDSMTYALSFAVLGMTLKTRAMAAMLKGGSLAAMGLFVLGLTLYRVFTGAEPEAPIMGGIGLLALAANLISVVFLLRFREGDSNIRSVWLCSRNDAIGNVAVLIAAGLVWTTGSYWPDLVVAAGMAGLFLHSATLILLRARQELAQGRAHRHVDQEAPQAS